MGSEQSTQSGSGSGGNSNHQRDLLSPSSRHFDPLLSLSREGALSPERQESVSSDFEDRAQEQLPYVSYTVNKPIGESPKKKRFSAAMSGSSSGNNGSRYRFASPKFQSSRLSKSQHNTLVTVNQAPGAGGLSKESSDDLDPDLARLADIPSFLPIMRASLSSRGSLQSDPDILERLDYRGLLSLCQRYQDHFRCRAEEVGSEQAELTKLIRDTDGKIAAITQTMAERQKQYAKSVEKLQKVNEMSKCLSKCHLLLNENIEQIENLNNMLPVEDRLEPFVWTTG